MSSGNALRLCLAALAAAIVLTNGGDQAYAEKQLGEPFTTIWSTTGKLQFGGGGVKTQKVDAAAQLGFGPITVPAVTGDFGMSITYIPGPGDGTIDFGGTYALTKPGKPTFIIDPFSLQSQFTGFVTKASLKAKLKTVKGVDTVDANLQIKFEECSFDSKGKVHCKKPTLTYKGQGGLAPPG